MKFDWNVSIGQVLITAVLLPTLYYLGKSYFAIRDGLVYFKFVISEFRPHDHGGHEEVLTRADLRFPKDL